MQHDSEALTFHLFEVFHFDCAHLLYLENHPSISLRDCEMHCGSDTLSCYLGRARFLYQLRRIEDCVETY
jgi:hypothetical protein